MTRTRWTLLAFALPLLLALAGCDDPRKMECTQLLGAMKPLDQGTPIAATVDGVSKQVTAIKFDYQPLAIYGTNYLQTLKVLSSTLKLKERGAAPDGTDGVIAAKLQEARTDRDDVQRLCAQ